MFTRLLLVLALLCTRQALSQSEGAAPQWQLPLREIVTKDLDYLTRLYQELHQQPELSFMEVKTAARMAAELREAGFEVHEKIGGHGVVGIMRNGRGPTLLIRADMDALPIKEETGLPYASTAIVTDDAGKQQPAMHACGHDIHMSVFTGTARAISKLKSHWQGTLMMVAQPAEEKVGGAIAMVEDGLYTRFGRPDYCVALHTNANMPTGSVGYCPGYAMANVNTVDITVYGEGGHGAYPHLTKDPIVLASNLVMNLQTIVSREISALDPAVITVGSFHGGSKHNIIPDEVKLQLTLRSYSPKVRQQMIEAIRRMSSALGKSAGLPESKWPLVSQSKEEAEALYNDPALTEKIAVAMRKVLGESAVSQVPPVMVSEDFGLLGTLAKPAIPVSLFWLGTIAPEKIAQAEKNAQLLPSLHSSQYAPEAKGSIDTGVKAMSAIVFDLLPSGKTK